MNLDGPIATGRDADIYDAGPGRVLRRSRKGGSQTNEARLMEYVVARGYPAPAVYDVSDDGQDLVMQRIEGPTMLDDLGNRPWLMRRHARALADLHTELGRIPAPEWLRPGPVPGDRVVHLDLHPGNVLVTGAGLVVIDWTNAAAGSPGSDVACTWLLSSCGEIPGPRWKQALFGAFRRTMVGVFIRRAGRGPAARDLVAITEWKCRDNNMRPAEVTAMRKFAARNA